MWHYPYNIPAQESLRDCIEYGLNKYNEWEKEYVHSYLAGLVCDPIMEGN